LTQIDSPSEFRGTEQIQYVIDSVHRYFTVTQEYITEGAQSLQFFIDSSQTDTKPKFLSLLEDLKKNGDYAILRNTDHGLMIAVVRKPPRGKSRVKTPIVLFIATIATVFIYGFFWGPSTDFKQSFSQDFTIGAIFAACLMGIIGIHEMGHKISSWHHKMDASWPYFIPFPPIPLVTLPTMGAVISARDPPPNRDALFDLGISGPLAGLFTTLVVSVIAATTAQFVSISSLGGTTVHSTDIFTSWIISALHPNQQGALTGSLFGALYFAYSLGFLLTFVNLLPAWQLDGGHIANAAVSPKTHQYLTWISAGIMVLAGFWIMAVLVLLLSSRAPSLRPLDDVSPLSPKRKAMFWATWIIAGTIFALVVYNNAFFWANII
jgi:membrane-associated protease RseP (regulator of RpoE activity)